MTRSAGILLHVSSLPGRYGIGDFGPEAERFLDFLATAGMSRWQVLPLGPAGFGGSPYTAESSFALDEVFVSPDLLERQSLVTPSERDAAAGDSAADAIDWARTVSRKALLLDQAFVRSEALRGGSDYAAFVADSRAWLDDYALYRVLKAHHGGAPWHQWEPGVRLRDEAALRAASQSLAFEIERQRFAQFVLDRQWREIRADAETRNIAIVGDIPIFPALDSADVWANQHLFKLDEQGHPTVVAGVPPDYFSETGQLWGNPHYDWPRHAEDGYSWWQQRFRWTFERVDYVRVDHFRAFAQAWEVPTGAATAIEGHWVDGPGLAIFERLGLAGSARIIAEDLGIITDDVRELLRATGFPGMRVLQFAFDSNAANEHLPHNHVPRSVVFSGTHDNDTTLGWLATLATPQRERIARYLGWGGDLADAIIRAALASVAETAVLPMQDVLRLGSEARMNRPAAIAGNWRWRMSWEQLPAGRAGWLRDLAELYGRTPA